jgi:hypothetical protein
VGVGMGGGGRMGLCWLVAWLGHWFGLVGWLTGWGRVEDAVRGFLEGRCMEHRSLFLLVG